jgi:murein DD-endopeptidase MepM/ murein hydrolase activator NlpD
VGRLESFALRLGVLALVAVASASVFVAVRLDRDGRALVLPSGSVVPGFRKPALRVRSRCVSRHASVEVVDRRLARLVAPVTRVKLARPLRVTPPLGTGRYVFPVLGPFPPFFDTFGAPRPGVSWHHGDDLFAESGRPLLAVTDGVVFSVGWERLGGWRLWLIDAAGDEFYYAHLQRYSRLAVDGRIVRAGQMLGYVGNSGDAEHTPPHLHFEIHPASLLGLGYDGAVDPTPYLRVWRQLRLAVPPSEPPAARSLAAGVCGGGSPGNAGG